MRSYELCCVMHPVQHQKREQPKSAASMSPERSPLLPLSFFRNPTFSAAILVGLLLNIFCYGLIFLFSLFFQQAKGYSPFVAGLAFLPMTAGVIIRNVMAGKLRPGRDRDYRCSLGKEFSLLAVCHW
jgi:hypothetical protein